MYSLRFFWNAHNTFSPIHFLQQAIQNKLAQREQELAERAKALENGNPSERGASTNDSRKQNPDAAQMSALTNLLVVVGFAVFAWTVTYIVSTLSEEEG